MNGSLNQNFEGIVLDGASATPAVIARIANGEPVSVAPKTKDRVEKAYRILLQAAKEGHKIYGLTVGVGLNKDRPVLDASGQLDEAQLAVSRQFNAGLILSHAAGIGPALDERTARAVMAVRLNTILIGASGVRPAVMEMIVNFLNAKITPVIPCRGSIGEADITVLSHIGMAMLGRGDVFYEGKRIPAADAMRAAGLAPIELFAKDGLGIISSNAYAAGMGVLALIDMERLQHASQLVFALSLEALNGNISPILEDVTKLRKFPSFLRSAAALRNILKGSYLWDRDDDRALQDPLSYRTAPYILGVLDECMRGLAELMHIQINAADDNPAVVVGALPTSNLFQERRAYVDGGALFPTANFDPLPWVLSFEQYGISLAHHANAAAQRVSRLGSSYFTGLSRYLGTEETLHGLEVIDVPLFALVSEMHALAHPVSFDSVSLAGGVEDVATNAPLVVRRVRQQIDLMFSILAIELIHAAQAIDLRKQKVGNIKMSPTTGAFQNAFRNEVPFMDVDRPFTEDIARAEEFLKEYGR
jgi:histidine ammonia-lyase